MSTFPSQLLLIKRQTLFAGQKLYSHLSVLSTELNISIALSKSSVSDTSLSMDKRAKLFSCSSLGPKISFQDLLKRIKTYLRASVGQEGLNDIAIIAIERDLLEALDLEKASDIFADIDRGRRIKMKKNFSISRLFMFH